MLKEVICTAASVEEAKSAVIAELNPPKGVDITFEVLEAPVKKTLGLFGGAPAKVKGSYMESDYEETEEYIRMMIKGMGINDAVITTTEDGDDIKVNIECDEGYGAIIGRKGETIDAIQFLARLVYNKGKGEYKRITINIGNYREKRESVLKDIAAKTAEKVKKYGRNISLDPMNPSERRIIHTIIQGIEGVESFSVGSDSARRVIVAPTEGNRKNNNYNNNNNDRRRNDNYKGNKGNNDFKGGNRGGGHNQNNNSRGNSRPPAQQQQQQQRPPRSDVQNASRYGRIDVNN